MTRLISQEFSQGILFSAIHWEIPLSWGDLIWEQKGKKEKRSILSLLIPSVAYVQMSPTYKKLSKEWLWEKTTTTPKTNEYENIASWRHILKTVTVESIKTWKHLKAIKQWIMIDYCIKGLKANGSKRSYLSSIIQIDLKNKIPISPEVPWGAP